MFTFRSCPSLGEYQKMESGVSLGSYLRIFSEIDDHVLYVGTAICRY